MKNHTITTYNYTELSDDAKQKAIEVERQFRYECDNDWHEYIYDDAKYMANILGIDITCIYFTGFCSQGDGACFEGDYRYNSGATKTIRHDAPNDTELHEIADELQAIQRRHFYQLTAGVKHRGHYYHSGCTDIEVWRGDDYAEAEPADDLAAILRSFMDWIYKRLESEWEWRISDETIDEWLSEGDAEYYQNGTVY